MAKSKKLRNSAKGQDCNVRIPGWCSFNPETTILAHVGIGSGMGQKSDDIEATFCCSVCHDIIDRRMTTNFNSDEIKLMAKEGAERTRKHWLQVGLIKVAA